jgi:hypothetical protein
VAMAFLDRMKQDNAIAYRYFGCVQQAIGGNKGHFARLKHCHLVLLLWMCIVPQSANAQINTGTIVILGQSLRKAVFAADSRAIINSFGNLPARIDDSYCKLSTSNSRFVFATYGTGGDEQWISAGAAKSISDEVLASSPSVTFATMNRIVNAWTQSAREWFSKIGEGGIQRLRSIIGRDDLLGGVFALRLDDDTIAYRNAIFSMIESNGHYGISVRLNPLVVSPTGETTFSGFGATDIFAMFTSDFGGMTATFVSEEKARWRSASSVNLDAYEIRRIVEITIEHPDPRGTVGGHVNAVEITAGGMKWITDNPECNGK